MADKKLNQSNTRTDSPQPAEKKVKPKHSDCEFCRDTGLCKNMASMFSGQTRELDSPVCSAFKRRNSQ